MKKTILILAGIISIFRLHAQDTLRSRCQDITKEDIRKTLAQHKLVLQRQPGNQAMLYSVGMCYYKLHDAAAALPYFDTLARLNPHYGAIFLNRGICKLFLGDKSGACDDFKNCIQFDKDYDDVLDGKSLSEYIKTKCN